MDHKTDDTYRLALFDEVIWLVSFGVVSLALNVIGRLVKDVVALALLAFAPTLVLEELPEAAAGRAQGRGIGGGGRNCQNRRKGEREGKTGGDHGWLLRRAGCLSCVWNEWIRRNE